MSYLPYGQKLASPHNSYPRPGVCLGLDPLYLRREGKRRPFIDNVVEQRSNIIAGCFSTQFDRSSVGAGHDSSLRLEPRRNQFRPSC